MPVDNIIIPFNREYDFETALCEQLKHHGWEPQVIMCPTEQDLIRNWKAIIFNNNREMQRLGEYPLTDSEMDQIIQQVNACGSPYKVNQLINHGLVSVVRDNADDVINFGKTVYLKIFDAREINSGQSVYQIVRQPKFATAHPLAGDRRGDVMLLINGMPMFHIELKRSGVDVTQAVNQIKKYAHEGVFSRGIFSLVQIFVAMTPNKTLYFANPGDEKNFSPSYYFHWSDSNNEEFFDWKKICANLLSIPLAHRMIGYYTIADDKDSTLKVLRSYQYDAVNAICDRVHNTIWDDHAHRGGFVWHTTGSGKTMTSFKSAQLISKAGDADKVVFLLDRIELSVQSVDEYRNFADVDEDVLDTENTAMLVSQLESDDTSKCLIVTSIQKMSRINNANGIAQSSIDHINGKRVVFIVDECHRSVRGSGGENGSGMLMSIKKTFPRALLFGFTGTPIFAENAQNEITTEVIFGDMLSKYTIANGIPDGNVLGFDIYRESTADEAEMRHEVALRMAEVEREEDLEADPDKRAIFEKYMDPERVGALAIEDEARSYYTTEEHHIAVMNKIVGERPVLSHNGKFHAILATKNIPEAIEYYRLFKLNYPSYNVAAIFDDSIDNSDNAVYREDAILEMLNDYNSKFGQHFQQSTYAKYKKDVALRLAHKTPYKRLEKNKQIDLLIVVTQMLTGYDSKWINTLYVDKLLKYVDVIQAFSRTNRLFGPEKPFGIIKYFCRPYRMEKYIQDALDLYVDQPQSVFVDKLEANLEKINQSYDVIYDVFKAEGIVDFNTLPQAEISKKKFALEFCKMTKLLEASKMQGFSWDKLKYEFKHVNGWVSIEMKFDEMIYKVLLQRYRELFENGGDGTSEDDDVYHFEAYLTETGVGTIDADYINANFIRYVKYLYTLGEDNEKVTALQKQLHQVFATLSQRDQRTVLTILHDIRRGDLVLSPNNTIFDYINQYQKRQTDAQIFTICDATGLNIDKLKDIVRNDVSEDNIDDMGRFQDLMSTLDKNRAKDFLKRVSGDDVKSMFVVIRISEIIRDFILSPDNRLKIIYALENENSFYGKNITDDEVNSKANDDNVTTPTSARLSDEEKRNNVTNMVVKKLRGVSGMPMTSEAVKAFFKVVNIPSVNHFDGIAFDMFDSFDELFARSEVTFVKKHVCSGNLIVKFEVFLKKMYYLLNGREAEPTGDEYEVTLVPIIRRFDCLKQLRTSAKEKERKLYEMLENVKSWRSTASGNGAHFAMFLPDEALDKAIESIVTLYIYVTGMCLKQLKERYPNELNDINALTANDIR